MSQDLELAELLSSHYGQRIPRAEYHTMLVQRLQVAVGASRQRSRTAGMLAAAAGLLLVGMSAWWIHTAFNRTPPATLPVPAVASSLPKSIHIVSESSQGESTFLSNSSPKALFLADMGPEQSLSPASLVVRVRIDDINGTLVHYTILRTIFGVTEAKSVDQDFTSGSAVMLKLFRDFSRSEFIKRTNRAPSDAELDAAVLSDRGIILGAEDILILEQVTGADGKVEFRLKSSYAAGLDEREKEIVDAIQSGGFLNLPSARSGGDTRRDLPNDGIAAIRATLGGVDDHAATWKVTKTIAGKIDTRTVVISHDLFHLRALAVARHAALEDAALKEPKAFEARVDAEMKKMITAELVPQREAILVLTNCSPQGDDTRANLVGREYEDATGGHLDQVEAALVPGDNKRL